MSPDDPRQGLVTLLADYSARHPQENEISQRYSNFVVSHPNCFERSLVMGHVTGSALVLDQTRKRVLFTHHKKLNRWLQPGGHADGDTDVLRVAMTEAQEESGLPDLTFVSEQILDLDIHEIPARKNEPAHFHFDCRFLIQATGSDRFEVSDESHDLAWADIDNISDYTTEDSIVRMITKARQFI